MYALSKCICRFPVTDKLGQLNHLILSINNHFILSCQPLASLQWYLLWESWELTFRSVKLWGDISRILNNLDDTRRYCHPEFMLELKNVFSMTVQVWYFSYILPRTLWSKLWWTNSHLQKKSLHYRSGWQFREQYLGCIRKGQGNIYVLSYMF